MKQKGTYIALLVIAVVGLAMLIVSKLIYESMWYDAVLLVPLLCFMLAVGCLLRLCQKKSVRVIYYILLGLLFFELIQRGLSVFVNFEMVLGDSEPRLFGLMLYDAFLYKLTYYEIALDFVLMILIFNLDSTEVNLVILGGLISLIINTTFYVYFNELYYLLPLDINAYHIPWKVIDVVVGSLWIVGAMVMGIRGLRQKPDATPLQEVQNG